MNRTLHYAIALSIALHGVMLFGLSPERRAGKPAAPPPPLEARLVEPPAPPAPPAPPPPPPPPKVEPVKPAPPPNPKPVVKPLPRPKPPPAAPVARPAPEAVQPPQPEPAPAPSVARIEPAPAPPPPGPSAEQLEAVTREQYRLELIDAARRHNRYPPLARENNWEGEVRVRMQIGADGAVSLDVEKSSGHPVLDRQALEMFRRAQAQVPVPASLRGKALSFELRAVYNLKDQVSG